MRFIELLLLADVALLPLWPLARGAQKRWLAILYLAPLPLLPLHWLIEGYRWQMAPAYLIALLAVAVGLRRLRRPGTDLGRPRRRRHGAAALLLAVLLVPVMALPYLLPVPRLPQLTGPYEVGTVVLHLVDENRPEIYAATGTATSPVPREVMLQIWYPAVESTAEPAPYIDQIELAAPVLASSLSLPSFFLDHIALARPGARLAAPMAPADTPWPLVLFSHGLTGYRSQNTFQVEMLASQGYLVAAVDHTYGAGFTVLPPARVIIYDVQRVFPSGATNPEEGAPLMAQWAADLNFVVDELARLNDEADSPFFQRIDVEHVGAMGHSTGGGAVVRFCAEDARCRAGIALDAWLLPLPAGLIAVPPPQPFLYLSTPVWLGAENRARGTALVAAQGDHATWATIAGAAHFDFTDLSLLSPLTPYLGLSGDLDGPYMLPMINDLTLSFFDHQLRDVTDDTLSGALLAYPEITLEQQR